MKKRYWFRQKSFGYGATPCSWEGWTLTVVALLLIALVVLVGPGIRGNIARALFLVLGIATVMLPFGLIAWRKTEGGWRWRD